MTRFIKVSLAACGRSPRRRDGDRRWVAWLRTVALAVCLTLPGSPAAAQRKQPRVAGEYEIKAAYLYNFLLFVDWPEAKQDHMP